MSLAHPLQQLVGCVPPVPAVLKGIDDLKVKGFRPDQMQVAPACPCCACCLLLPATHHGLMLCHCW